MLEQFKISFSRWFPIIFSLTPALSRWEREKRFQLQTKNSDWIGTYRA
jgi:hypothetical protein